MVSLFFSLHFEILFCRLLDSMASDEELNQLLIVLYFPCCFQDSFCLLLSTMIYQGLYFWFYYTWSSLKFLMCELFFFKFGKFWPWFLQAFLFISFFHTMISDRYTWQCFTHVFEVLFICLILLFSFRQNTFIWLIFKFSGFFLVLVHICFWIPPVNFFISVIVVFNSRISIWFFLKNNFFIFIDVLYFVRFPFRSLESLP